MLFGQDLSVIGLIGIPCDGHRWKNAIVIVRWTRAQPGHVGDGGRRAGLPAAVRPII
jgi:hypothetical protein